VIKPQHPKEVKRRGEGSRDSWKRTGESEERDRIAPRPCYSAESLSLCERRRSMIKATRDGRKERLIIGRKKIMRGNLRAAAKKLRQSI